MMALPRWREYFGQGVRQLDVGGVVRRHTE